MNYYAVSEGCPGLYCGKKSQDSVVCEACPWGYRRNESNSLCESCSKILPLYDWVYLVFMALLPLLLNAIAIQFYAHVRNSKVPAHSMLQHASALFECSVAFILTLLVLEPLGSPALNSCGVRSLSDWYPMFFNPSINHSHTLHCTQEIVYPLYTVPFIHYFGCLLLLGLIRTVVLWRVDCVKVGASNAVYAALYFLPVLTVVHGLFAGLIYYSFPYILLAIALFTNAAYLALFEKQQSPRQLCAELRKKPRHLIVLGVHVLLYAFGILAIANWSNPALSGSLILLALLPSAFYISSVMLSDPDHIMLIY